MIAITSFAQLNLQKDLVISSLIPARRTMKPQEGSSVHSLQFSWKRLKHFILRALALIDAGTV
jgi:hypothetical protein